MEPSNQASRISRSDGHLTPGIGILVEAWAAAWNAHDMPRAAALVAADVDFVTVAGRWLKGRDEFLRHHRDIHRRQMRDTTWQPSGTRCGGFTRTLPSLIWNGRSPVSATPMARH